MYNGRRVSLVAGVKTLLVENHQETSIPWTVYTNCVSTDGVSILIEIELLNVGYGTSTTIQYTIAGTELLGIIGGTGDYYSGVGACRIFATSILANTVSVAFSEEQTSMYIPPISSQITAGVIGTVSLIGYPPFSRYMTSIYTDANFNMVLLDDTGVNSFNQVFPPSRYVHTPRFFHPSNARMRLISTVAAQRYIITHSQA